MLESYFKSAKLSETNPNANIAYELLNTCCYFGDDVSSEIASYERLMLTFGPVRNTFKNR